MALIFTTKGEIEESLLSVEEASTDIPCGKSIQKKWFLNGELVKQDTTIKVDQAAMPLFEEA